jgi:hypothetical protein
MGELDGPDKKYVERTQSGAGRGKDRAGSYRIAKRTQSGAGRRKDRGGATGLRNEPNRSVVGTASGMGVDAAICERRPRAEMERRIGGRGRFNGSGTAGCKNTLIYLFSMPNSRF